MPENPSRRVRPAHPALVIMGLVIAAAAWTLPAVGGNALLGFDAYPLIAASRIDSLGSFLGTFGEELMDGRYPDGHFYRPLVHLSFAIDHAIGGLDPARYFATDMAILAIAACLIGLIATYFAGASDRSRITAGGVAALLFVLHRAQLDVVPYAARRADGMCILFVAATAYAAVRGARPWAVGVLALGAFLSKESGVIALPVAFAATLTRESIDVRSAARATVAPLAALAVGVIVRTVVLDGIGGHDASGAVESSEMTAVISGLWHALTSESVAGSWGVCGLLLGLAVPLCGHPVARRGLALAAVWSTAAFAITLVSGRYHDWYALALVPGLALAAGSAAGRAVDTPRGATLAAGLCGVALLLNFAASSLGTPQRAALRVAQVIAADQAERFRALVVPFDGPIETTEVVGEVRFFPWVFAVDAAPGAPPIFVHAPYSLTALADLTLSSVRVTVLDPGLNPQRAAIEDPKAIVVRLVPGPPPAAVLTALNDHR